MGGAETSFEINIEKCTGCKLCELACSFARTGSFNLSKSLIKAAADGYIYAPITCLHCADPDCARVCPTGAISKNGAHGAVTIDESKCLGCLLCTLSCPHGGIFYSSLEDKVSKCDLCDGSPECVKFCGPGAIGYIDHVKLYEELREKEDLLSPGLSFCVGCAHELAMRFVLKVLGMEVIAAIPPGCIPASGSGGYGATSGAKVPIFLPLLTNTAAMLAGVKRHYQRAGRKVHAVAFAGDGGTADCGFQALSGAAERGENIIYICLDNEGYMNTGIQRSGTTPFGAWTTTTPVGETKRGKPQRHKDLPMIMAMHDVPYVATANLAFLEDFALKLKSAAALSDGLAYIHLFSPCPTGWRFPSEKTIEVSRLAVQTNFFPLWEARDGEFRITVEIKSPKPVGQYLALMGKYEHMTQSEVEKFQAIIDLRYQRLLTMVGSRENMAIALQGDSILGDDYVG